MEADYDDTRAQVVCQSDLHRADSEWQRRRAEPRKRALAGQ